MEESMKIDARGLACPQPVLMVKEQLENIEEGVLTVLVDNKGSSINVRNFCESNGHTVNVNEKEGIFQLDIAKGYPCEISDDADGKNIVIHISGESMGSEEPELGRKLMKGFLANLKNLDRLPDAVILVNNSVRMATLYEDTIASLKELSGLGVKVLSCGICLEHYQLVDSLKAGEITDALTVGNMLMKADKVIRM